jgi:hypothetical protein
MNIKKKLLIVSLGMFVNKSHARVDWVKRSLGITNALSMSEIDKHHIPTDCILLYTDRNEGHWYYNV